MKTFSYYISLSDINKRIKQLISQKIYLTGRIICNELSMNFNVNYFVDMYKKDYNKIEMEFFKKAQNVDIKIVNESKQFVVFEERINTCKGLHLIIATADWEVGKYQILINTEDCIEIKGDIIKNGLFPEMFI